MVSIRPRSTRQFCRPLQAIRAAFVNKSLYFFQEALQSRNLLDHFRRRFFVCGRFCNVVTGATVCEKPQSSTTYSDSEDAPPQFPGIRLRLPLFGSEARAKVENLAVEVCGRVEERLEE